MSDTKNARMYSTGYDLGWKFQDMRRGLDARDSYFGDEFEMFFRGFYDGFRDKVDSLRDRRTDYIGVAISGDASPGSPVVDRKLYIKEKSRADFLVALLRDEDEEQA